MARFFINRPIFAWVIAIVIMLAGLASIFTLPLEQYPDNPAALTALYTRGSRTGRRDRAMLAAYDARGLHVTRLRTQVLGASLRSSAPGRVTLEVTDRVVGAHAVGGGVRIPLPRDRTSTRVISLRRVAGAWRVDEVRDQ